MRHEGENPSIETDRLLRHSAHPCNTLTGARKQPPIQLKSTVLSLVLQPVLIDLGVPLPMTTASPLLMSPSPQ